MRRSAASVSSSRPKRITGRGARWIHAVYTPHRDAAGRVVGVVVMVHDMTETRRAADALRETTSRFDLVRDGAQVGFWFCDLPFEKLIWDNRVKEHFWLSPEPR